MDDPLKPTSVPLEAETILWFEFLLNPTLLTTHLQKENASPTCVELISKFLSMAPENQNNTVNATATTPDIESAMNRNEGLKIGRKQLALKILGLKVASFLKWNLQIIERNLSLQKQVQLLSDLCSITSGKIVNLPLSLVHECQLGPEGSKRAFNFALTLYHRWVLRAQVLKEIPPRVFKQGFNHILLTNQDQANSFRDEMFLSSLEPFTQNSIDFLNQICQDEEPFTHLTYASFVALNANTMSDRLEQDFEKSIVISKAELRSQIAYDLCDFYLYDKKYKLAKQKVLECRDNLEILKKEYAEKSIDCSADNEDRFVFCTFSEEDLNGRLMALGIFDKNSAGLLYRMNESILNNHKEIDTIFEQDNILMEIPLVNRRIVESNLEAELQRGLKNVSKEELIRIAALNKIRSIVDPDDLFSFNDFLHKYGKQNGLKVLVDVAVAHVKQTDSEVHKQLIGDELSKIFLTSQFRQLKQTDIELIEKSGLITKSEFNELKRSKQEHDKTGTIDNMNFSPLVTMTDWIMSDTKSQALELGALKRQLISCTTATAVRTLLVKCTNLIITSDPPLSMEPWHINPSWIMPIQIKSLLMSLPRGFLQDFTYILISKAKDLAARHEFATAISLLNGAKTEVLRHDTNTTTARLNKLIDNEILFIQATQRLHDWLEPSTDTETEALTTKCKQALKASSNRENVVPRTEILGACAAVLLNLNETTDLIRNDRRFPFSELCIAIAAVVHELEHKTNASKKAFRDAWDLIAPMFANNGGGHTGSSGRRSHQQPMDIDDSGDKVDHGSRNNDGDDAGGPDSNMQFDEHGAAITTGGSNGDRARTTDDDFDRNNSVETSGNNSPQPGSSTDRTDSNPFRNSNRNNNHNNDGYGIRDSPAVIVNTNLLPFIQKLRNPLPITVMLSLLSRLHNILDDNSNRELNIEHINIWPTSITNASSYNLEIVVELLNITFKQALQYHPQHVHWIRLEGDFEFRNENYEASMASYVNAIITGSEYCTSNLEQHTDDYIIRRMIKCCSNLGCYMQAAVLCQFLEEIDYTLAFKTFSDRTTFKAISDKSIIFSDAMDSYYSCIWDATLLEFIVNFLVKRGEHTRKQLAIAALGQLELNANNNDEVKREAALSRQVKFIRALAKQYTFISR